MAGVHRPYEAEETEEGEAMKSYFVNWSLYLRGFRWLWSRQVVTDLELFSEREGHKIRYKPGWTPARFLLPYCTTYFLGVLFGCGVVSLSRWWYDRSEVKVDRFKWQADAPAGHSGPTYAHPFSRAITDFLDWAFPGLAHGRHTGGWLWSSTDCWK
jgi:hypothetical protein